MFRKKWRFVLWIISFVDHHNFYVVRTLLEISRNKSEVLLLKVFGKNRYIEKHVTNGVAWKEDWHVFAADVKKCTAVSIGNYL